MALWNSVKRQLRSVIEWDTFSPDSLFFRWTDNGDEIKNASTLLINPGQGCIFVYEGKVQAVHMDEGKVQLQTANIPFWTTVSKFMQAFESEHKVGLYFFRRAEVLDQKWGTSSVIKYDDSKYGIPVGLRVFGNYTFRITDPAAFFVNVVSASPEYTVTTFRTVLNARIVQPLTDYMAEAGYSYAQIDAKREELARGLLDKMIPEFANLGFEVSDFRIEGTSFDEDTMRRINRIADVTAEAQAAEAAGLNYAKVQQLEAMREAAKNEGGGAGLGMGLGAGMGFGQMMAGAMGNQVQQSVGQTATTDETTNRLRKLKELFDGGLISQEEFSAKKQEILSKL